MRDENADLRRQVYGYRVNFGHLPPQPPGSEPNKQGRGWGDVKQEGAFGVTYGQSSMESPQRADSSSRGPPRQSGEVVGVREVLLLVHSLIELRTPPLPTPRPAPPHPAPHPTPLRSTTSPQSTPAPGIVSCRPHPSVPILPACRMLTSAQAPSQSPYLPSNSFQGPRYTADPNTAPGPSTGPHPVRYESMYPAPPPHNLPRSGPGLYEMQGHNHPYAPRPDGEGMPWVPEVSAAGLSHRMLMLIWFVYQSGPPPFQGSVPYPMGFPHDNQQGGEDWRQEH